MCLLTDPGKKQTWGKKKSDQPLGVCEVLQPSVQQTNKQTYPFSLFVSFWFKKQNKKSHNKTKKLN